MPGSRYLIASQTLGSSQASVVFSSIPDTYTDLVLKISARDDGSGSAGGGIGVRFNGDTSGSTSYSVTRISGTGSSASSSSQTSASNFNFVDGQGAASTTNTFSTSEVYIPSYTNSTNKPINGFGAQENNNSVAYIRATSGLYQNTAAITSIYVFQYSGFNFLAGSTFYLYGVTRTNATSAPNTPTIGTASDNGDGTASVTFTPSGSGSTSDIYKITSSPDSITAYSYYSPATVYGLTAGTSYTFTVQAINNAGASSASSASNSVTLAGAAYESIATVTATGGETALTFNSIPGTYKAIQIRGRAQYGTGTNTASASLQLRINSDTGSNYAMHFLRGDGSSTYAQGITSMTRILLDHAVVKDASYWGVFTLDLQDYASTSKNKTLRYIAGNDTNGAVTTAAVALGSGLWMSTSAVTSIEIAVDGSYTYAAGTTFSLYGVK